MTGDIERFQSLFERTWPDVERYARRRVGPDDAADVAADTFAVAWRRFAEVPDDPVPWLYGVARRVVANHRRSADRAVRLVDRLVAVSVPRGAPPDPGAAVPASMALAAAFDRLTDADREVLALQAWEGLDARRAAAALGCGISAYTMRLTRARRRLLALLDEQKETP